MKELAAAVVEATDHLACPGPVTPGPQLSRSYRVENDGPSDQVACPSTPAARIASRCPFMRSARLLITVRV